MEEEGGANKKCHQYGGNKSVFLFVFCSLDYCVAGDKTRVNNKAIKNKLIASVKNDSDSLRNAKMVAHKNQSILQFISLGTHLVNVLEQRMT